MKVLFIVPSYKPAYVYGGPVESVAKLCEGLVAEGWSVDVFTTTANGKTELTVVPGREMDVDGVNVTYFRRITKDHTHISPALWRRLYTAAGRYDIVHIQSWWNILVIVSAVICHLKGVKVIVSPRGMLSDYVLNSGKSRSKKIIHRLIGKYALSHSFFHATAVSEYNECIGLIKGWKGFVKPNVLALPDIQLEKVNNDRLGLIYLSRIHPKKGLEVLFDVLAGSGIDFSLKIAGSGDVKYVGKLRAQADNAGIGERIEWTGWLAREEKFKELMKADLLVLVSQNENFANVVIESLHMGTPVLISEDVALSSFVKEYDLGWVTSLDPEDIKLYLLKAYNEKDKRLRIQQQGRELVQHVFSQRKLVSEYKQEYLKIIG